MRVMGGVSWVLLVEDEPDHRVLVREALGRVGADVQVHEVADARQGVAWMQKRMEEPASLAGGMVILDVGLPRNSGFRLLEWMRDMPELSTFPVVVLTAWENPMDAEHAFNLGARGYFQKPTDFQNYLDIFERVFALPAPPTEEGGP